MLLKYRLLLAVLCTLVAAAYSADVEHPFKKANIGDWVEYKTSNDMGGMKTEMGMKQTLIAKTEEEATMEITTKMMGRDMKQEVKIKLNEKYDPIKQMAQGDVKPKLLGEGDESITVGGKTFKAHWTQYEIDMKTPQMQMTMKSKVWVAPAEVPLGGMVKTETQMGEMGKSTTELKDFGKGK
ncbi:MAG TPA: hypothetical protein VGP72_30030 [Planctomycetota bacterium]